MAGEIRRLTLFRGYDPREFVVFAFGGGGPTHAGMYARELGVKQVVVPLRNAAAVWSALGAFVGGVVHLYERNEYLREPIDAARSTPPSARWSAKRGDACGRRGFDSASILMERTIAMKYCAQVSHLEITVPNGELEQGYADRLLNDFRGRLRAALRRGRRLPRGGSRSAAPAA